MQRRSPLILICWLILMAVGMTSGGCGSSRIVSSIKPSGDRELNFGSVRFSLAQFDFIPDKKNPVGQDYYIRGIDFDLVKTRAKELYPNIFTDEWTALPLFVKTEVTFDDTSATRSAVLTACTLGIVPFSGTTRLGLDVSSSLYGSYGDLLIHEKSQLNVDFVLWMSLLGPLGCIPVPGEADLPRDGIVLFIPTSGETYSKTKFSHYAVDCMVETIVRSIRRVDIAALDRAYRRRVENLQRINVDGKEQWVFLAPVLKAGKEEAESMVAVLYQERPQRGMQPLESIVVAQRDNDGKWSACNGYLRRSKNLTMLSVLMENALPRRVIARKVEAPPVEDFIDMPNAQSPRNNQDIRWSNGVLLEAKNRSLASLLRYKSHDELLGLVTRIEKAILELSEQAERAKDRAQSIVEKGQGDPAQERELVILLRQRIEILKPILAAIKQQSVLGIQ